MNHPLVHRPAGTGHPYVDSPDSRTPVQPEAGQPVRLGVLADPAVSLVVCELETSTGSGQHESTRLPMAPAAPDPAHAAALAGGDGHLAQAQAASLTGADDGQVWQVRLDPVQAGTRYRYRFRAGAQATDWFDFTPGTWVAEAGTLALDSERLIEGSLRWLVAGDRVHRARFALRLAGDEHVVGFGERFDAVDQRGRRLDAVVFEQYKGQGRHGRTYLPMPFAHVVGPATSWGFHVRTSRRTWFDVAASEPDRLTVEVALAGEPDPTVRVGVYHGAPAEVLSAFTAEVGRAEPLPPWVFRLWASGNEWNTQRIVQDRMDRHRELDIPVGVVVIEAWSDEQTFLAFRDAEFTPSEADQPLAGTDFRYPPDGAWPDPKGMVERLHEGGIKVVLWQVPLLQTRPELSPEVPDGAAVIREGEALVRGGHAVREADGSPYRNRGWWFPRALMPDLSVARTRDWWTDRRRYLVRDIDIDGFKTDGGEHAWGDELRYADGRRGDEGNNRYPVHYARAYGDLLRSEGKPPVTFSRAGFTGSQAHGIIWAGDEDSTWEAYRSSVTAGITASACGIVYWGWDLAGFSGPVPDAELYLRAAGASTFMPIMQYHSEFNHHRRPIRDRTPWWVADVNDDPEVVAVFRRFAHLRERLVPYLDAQARLAIETGRPLMRALLFDHASDPRIWDFPLQFQLGDALLVSPVTAPGVQRWETYLPPGQWVDVWTGSRLEGGQPVTREVPREVVPVYCRADAWPGLAAVFE
jgi:1,3-alpha-isomaltosidase